MATDSSPSFIPKQPSRGTVKQRGTRKIYVLTYISFVLFFGTLIAAGGTFFYKISVDSQLKVEKQKLTSQRNLFNLADFERVKELNKKLTSAQKLLDEHVSVISILEALEKSTLSTIQIKSFALDRSQYSKIALNLEAETEDFNSVLFQRKVFAENPVLQGASIADLALNTNTPEQILLGAPKQSVVFTVAKDLTAVDIPYMAATVDALDSVSNQTATDAPVSTTADATDFATSSEATATSTSDVNSVTQ